MQHIVELRLFTSETEISRDSHVKAAEHNKINSVTHGQTRNQSSNHLGPGLCSPQQQIKLFLL